MIRSRRRCQWSLFALIAATAMLVTGCLDGSADLRITGDGSGHLVVTVEPDLDALPALVDLDDGAVSDLVGADDSDVTVENIGRPEAPVYRLRVEFDDHTDVTGPLRSGIRLGGVTIAVFSRFDLTESDDGWRLDAELRPLGQLVAEAQAAIGTLLSLPELEGAPSVEIGVELPGSIVETNATETDGDRAVWQVTNYDQPTMLALTNEGGDPDPVRIGLIAAGGVAALLVLITVGGAIGRRSGERRQRRRARRRAGADRRSDWQQPAVDTPDPDRPTTGVPLAWQTYKPTDEPHLPAAPWQPTSATPSASTPSSPTAPEPVGAPERSSAPAGWYPDPAGSGAQRWWDGTAWTEHTA